MSEKKAGRGSGWVLLVILPYLISVAFLLIEAITGYIVQVMTDRYNEADVPNKSYAAVARLEVVSWFAALSPESYPPGMRMALERLNIESVEHIMQVLNQTTTYYDLDFAQLEYETDINAFENDIRLSREENSVDTHLVANLYHPSDWLIGVSSESQLQHLELNGFTYMAKGTPIGAEYVVERDICIPVTREGETDIVQFKGVRAPYFADESDVADAFSPYGVVLKIEREQVRAGRGV